MLVARYYCFLAAVPFSFAFQPSRQRRSFVATAFLPLIASLENANAGVLSAKECIQGQGDGCLEMSGENDLIRSLQERSLANKDRNEREAKEAFYMKNYPDWFATIGKIMIKKSDGSFIVVDAEEAATLQKEGRLMYETPRSKGGTLIDYTQKPILVLKD